MSAAQVAGPLAVAARSDSAGFAADSRSIQMADSAQSAVVVAAVEAVTVAAAALVVAADLRSAGEV